jgi:hypothetical protein
MHLPSILAGAVASLIALPPASGQAMLAGDAHERDCTSRTQISEPVSGVTVTRSRRPLDCTDRAARQTDRARRDETDETSQTVIVLRSGHGRHHIRGFSTSPYVLGAPRPPAY